MLKVMEKCRYLGQYGRMAVEAKNNGKQKMRKQIGKWKLLLSY